MEQDIIELYRNAGYTPEQVIKDLSMMLGCAILSASTDTVVSYTSDSMDMKIEVIEKQITHT